MFKGICVPKTQYSLWSISIKPYYNRKEHITEIIPWGTNRFNKLWDDYTWRVYTLTFKPKRVMFLSITSAFVYNKNSVKEHQGSAVVANSISVT